MDGFTHRIASRMHDCRTENSFRMVAEARSLASHGNDIAFLMLGEPDFDTPPNIIKKAQWAIDHGHTHYTPSAGYNDLRERYADYVCSQYGIEDISGKNIVIQPGGSMICFITAVALIDPGDEAIVMDPTFPVYEQGVRMMGGVVRYCTLDEKSGWRFDPDRLESLITDKTKIVYLNSPQNPTGGILTLEDLEFVAGLARKHGFYVLSDEIYNRFVFEGRHSSILHIPNFLEQTILVDGHSKTYAMTGWRLAFSVTGAEIAERFADLMTLANCNTASFTQVAGDEALWGDQSGAESMIDEFKARSEIIYNGLNEIPTISVTKPLGAFYIFPNVHRYTTGYKGNDGRERTVKELQRILLHDYHVAVLPGTIFGASGKSHIRLSFAADRDTLHKAIERLKTAFAEIPHS